MQQQSPVSAEQIADAVRDLPPRKDEARSYIGASIIGHPCDAYLEFSLRGFPGDDVDQAKARIFRLGHLIEDEVVRILKEALQRAGLGVVFELDTLTGRQKALVEAGGHVLAHMDGEVVIGAAVLGLEIKSMNGESFRKFVREGIKTSHPRYYAQMQMMMAMGGYQHFLMAAYCKDNSDLHFEVVGFDVDEWNMHHVRIEMILNGVTPMRVAGSSDDWRCRGCFKSQACWHDAPVPRLCRTCAFAKPDISPTSNKKWHCTKHGGSHGADHHCSDWQRWKPARRP